MNVVEQAMETVHEVVAGLTQASPPSSPEAYTLSWTYSSASEFPARCVLWLNPEAMALHFRISVGVIARPHWSAVIKHMTGVNWALPNGCFALDPDDGELRFKASLFFGGIRLESLLVEHLVRSSLEFFDEHVHAFLLAAACTADEREENDENSDDKGIPSPDAPASFDAFVVRRYADLLATLPGLELESITDEHGESLARFVAARLGTRTPECLFAAPGGVGDEARARAAYERGEFRARSSAEGRALVQAFIDDQH